MRQPCVAVVALSLIVASSCSGGATVLRAEPISTAESIPTVKAVPTVEAVPLPSVASVTESANTVGESSAAVPALPQHLEVVVLDPDETAPNEVTSVPPVAPSTGPAAVPESTPSLAAPSPSPPTTPTTTADPDPTSGAVIGLFQAEINNLRASLALAELDRDPGLDAMAQSWAETMAADGSLRHSDLIYDVVGGGWVAAAENIAYGPDASSMFAGLRDSPGHYANMTDANYTHVGIGVVVAWPIIWTVHLYAG